MFVIDEAVIDDAIGRASFCCDLRSCKGACCCLEGGRGAPLENDEILEIENAFPVIRQYLSEESIRTIEARGLYEGPRGDYATTCIEKRACVFAYFENGIARCSFERAFLEAKTGWRKPLSCHLFPIRIRKSGGDFLRYEQIGECGAGRELGERHQIPLVEFLKEPLIRKYGEAWYDKVHAHCTGGKQTDPTIPEI